MFYIECMRIVCVHIPHFHVQVERLKRRNLEGRPVIVGGRPDERAPVIDCSEEAAERGVRPSLTLKEAYHLCPDAVFVRFEEGEGTALWEEIASMLQSFSVRIDAPDPGVAYLDITKALNVYGDESALAARIVRGIEELSHLEARAGIGNSRFVARMAVPMTKERVHVIPPGTEKRFVSSLPVETLPVEREIKERLTLLGLHNLGKIAPLSVESLIAQFGRPGKLISELSKGAGEGRPIPRMENSVYPEREVICEAPIEVMGYLGVFLGGAVAEIAEELAGMRRLCRAIKLILYLRNGSVLERQWIMHAPTASGEEMTRRIMDGLAAVAIESPITGFRVNVRALSRREPIPDTLFKAKPHIGESLKSVKDYLKTKYGTLPLVKVEERDPMARLPERRFVFVEP